MLGTDGYEVTTADSGSEALEALKRRFFDIVITDLYLTPVSGMEVLRAAQAAKRDTIVIVITGHPSVTTSIEALRAGAWDYLPKPFSAIHLQILVGRAAHVVLQSRQMHELRARLLSTAGHSLEIALLGTSPAFRSAVALARKVAGTDASVLLSGESGTGKELFASFIHHQSRRASKPFVAINCAALPEPLLESEMFGHRKGAFTGADRDKPGLFETAHGGTMLLDEITEMPLALQAKLLRTLQDGVVRRVGSERQDAVVDVRFISATNRDPQQAVKEGALRSDLLYRLRVVPIQLPSLRERREDIPLLATHFLSNFWERHRRPGTTPPKFSRQCIEFLRTRPWRGNVRELQNVVEHISVLAEPGQQITPADVPLAENSEGLVAITDALTPEILDEDYHTAREKLTDEFERVYLRHLVHRTGGNLARAARIAQVDRTTLYRLVEKHNLTRRPESELEAKP
jgi:DNA-binding NtrC family response regulator